MAKKKSPKLPLKEFPTESVSLKHEEKDASSELLVNQPSKWKNWWTRFTWTVVMITGFVAILYSGPVYAMLLVGFLQIIVYKEVLSISIIPNQERSLPWFRSLYWYYFIAANYFLYGESLIYYCKSIVFVDAFLMPLATHHRFISFSLYCLGLVVFVLNLKKGFYKFQFSMFCWIHMALIMIVFQSHLIINNIFEGLVWFILPCSLVITNDIFAYVAGFLFGKTPLISISPKKTWEGFMGAFVVTIIFAFFLAGFLGRFPYLTCPIPDVSLHGAVSNANCVPNPVFVPTEYQLWPSVSGALKWILMSVRLVLPIPAGPIRSVTLLPIQLHAIIFALFASLIAPFGGFFASGLKRAFNIKDFSNSIPGHGGLTDRMDCQFIMGAFACIYFHSFVKVDVVTVGSIVEFAARHLTNQDMVMLYARLGEYLEGQGLLDLASKVV